MPEASPLILEIFKQPDALRMGLFNYGQIAPTLRHYSQVGVSFAELMQLSAELVIILNRLAKDQPARIQQLKSLQKIGQLFWDHLLSRPVKIRLKEARPCLLVLSLDEELIQIPWELIFDGENFLGLKFSLGRLVRSQGESAALQYRDLKDSLKMLILANPNGDLKSAYLEGLNIKNQFSRKTRKVQVDFKSTNIDKHYVKRNICDYDIVHFAGHCEFNKIQIKDSGWVLSDGIFKIDDILRMGQSCSLPALVFSNACHSAQLNAVLVDSEYQRANYGMASAFLYAGVRHYIGAIRRIEDQASLVFAREFYSRLISGIALGEALRLSRLKLVKEYGLESLHWVNYLLYGDPGFVFLKNSQPTGIKIKKKLIYKQLILKIGLVIILGGLIMLLACWLPKINPTKLYRFLNAAAADRRGDNQAAINLSQQLIQEDPEYLAVYPILADAYQRIGNRDTASKYYFDYVLKSEKLGNRYHLVQAYIKLGWFYQLDGQYGKARELYEKALHLSRDVKDRQNEALVLRKLAVWYIDQGDFDQALDLLTKSVAINSEYPGKIVHLKNLAADYFDIGLVFTNKNDYESAKDFYLKSMKIFERLKLNYELSDCYFNLGEIYFYQKQYQKALDYYQKGLKLDQQYGNKVNLACGYIMIGELYLEIDDLERAESYFKQAAVLADEVDSRLDLADANYNLGLLCKRKGKKNLAREYWRIAQEINSQVDPEKYQQIREELLDLDNN